MKLIVKPEAIVGRALRTVVKDTLASHLVLLELALIIGTVLEDEFSMPMLSALKSSALISAAILIGFDGIDHLVFFLKHDTPLARFLRNPCLSFILLGFKLFELRLVLLRLFLPARGTRLGVDVRSGVAH